ncbi:MAG: acyltransferase [Steroidobacteraceae bacterium]|nr:acyltransferase [Steroidobacteraceae bacterium]
MSATGAFGRCRRLIKALLFAIALGAALPMILASWLEKRSTRGEAIFLLCSQCLAVVPGFPGRWLRGAFYFGTLERCSWETHIGFGSLFTHRGAFIGARVSMGAYCVIGHARIGDETMIGSRVSIPSGKRQHLDEGGRLAATTRFDAVSVGSRTWVGEGAILVADVGSECIVCAGAIVTKAMPNHCLIGGNPARIIRTTE